MLRGSYHSIKHPNYSGSLPASPHHTPFPTSEGKHHVQQWVEPTTSMGGKARCKIFHASVQGSFMPSWRDLSLAARRASSRLPSRAFSTPQRRNLRINLALRGEAQKIQRKPESRNNITVSSNPKQKKMTTGINHPVSLF